MADKDDILLKLVVRGMDPAEVKRLADQTYGQLKTEAARHIDALTALHRERAQAMDDATKKRVDEQIRAETKATDAIAKLMRQQEIEVNRVRNAWGRALEHMENITVVASGAWAAISGGAGRIKAAGDEIDRLTNIYGSLKGSIDTMREATAGEVADIDLITTKNRAFAKDLQLTDQQFGMVAAAADAFADSLALNTKDALDKIIDGLATGEATMLKNAGVVIDAQKAQEDFARSLGTTADKLSDTGKKTAVAEAALRAMDKGVAESGGSAKNFAHEWETTMAKLQNVYDKVFLAIGKKIVEFMRYWTVEVPHGIEIAVAKIKDILPGQDGNAQAAIESYLRDRDAANAADTRMAEAAAKRLAGNGDAYKIAMSDSARGAAIKQGGGSQEKRETLEDIAKRMPTSFGQDNEDITELLAAQTVGKAGDIEAWIAQQEEAVARAEEAQRRFTEQYDQGLEETANRGGWIGALMWGPDGPDQLYEQMDKLSQYTTDSMGTMSNMISGAAKAMTNAIGKSLAASISGAEAQKKSLKMITHETLAALSEQAIVRALFETADGIANLAKYHYAEAALNFGAAAAFGAVGVAAGLGARATGSAAASGASSSYSSSGMSSSRPSQFGSGGVRDSGDAEAGEPRSYVFNMTVMPGGEAEAGRSVIKAIEAVEAKDGRVFART
jgi:hypothetical protein